MMLNHLRFYVKYNILFDLIFFGLGAFFIMQSISNKRIDNTLLLIGFLFSGAIISKIGFTIISTKKLIEKVKNTKGEYPGPKNKKDFYSLNVSIKEEGDSLEIVKGHHLAAFIKRQDIKTLSEDSYLVELQTYWSNFHTIHTRSNGIMYYQIFIYDGIKMKELLSIEEHETLVPIHDPLEGSENSENFSEVGDKVANYLDLPIKRPYIR